MPEPAEKGKEAVLSELIESLISSYANSDAYSGLFTYSDWSDCSLTSIIGGYCSIYSSPASTWVKNRVMKSGVIDFSQSLDIST